MKEYKISIDSDALLDTQQATDWYNEQLFDLGSRFQVQVIIQNESALFHTSRSPQIWWERKESRK